MSSTAARCAVLSLALLGACADREGAGGPACGNGILEEGELCDDGNDLDGDGCSSDCSRKGFRAELRFNGCPALSTLIVAPGVIPLERSATLQAHAEDPDGDPFFYYWSVSEGELSDNDFPSVRYTCSKPGTQIVTLWLYDASGCAVDNETELLCVDPR